MDKMRVGFCFIDGTAAGFAAGWAAGRVLFFVAWMDRPHKVHFPVAPSLSAGIGIS
ncbi:MAG: hypothetical protein AMXMBFR84_18340 [Candidatus Hydrogenedentota bacterium]